MGFEETRGSYHPSDLDEIEEQDKRKAHKATFQHFLQGTLDDYGWRDPNISTKEEDTTKKIKDQENEIIALRQAEVKRVEYLDRLRRSVEILKEEEQ
jgi:hypothetical protein